MTGSAAKERAGEFAWEQRAETGVGLAGSHRYRLRVSCAFMQERPAN